MWYMPTVCDGAEIFKRLDGICPPHAILATNTSSLDIDQIAASTSRPSQVLGRDTTCCTSPADLEHPCRLGGRTHPACIGCGREPQVT